MTRRDLFLWGVCMLYVYVWISFKFSNIVSKENFLDGGLSG